ncbi:MAG: NAD(P)/FAD-dependent oxidoreductase [Planctomycetaceae bacterium]|nr:NAD(P)/FAD-dependent oxidoreductase [Planctomycetaceae bacterium]
MTLGDSAATGLRLEQTGDGGHNNSSSIFPTAAPFARAPGRRVRSRLCNLLATTLSADVLHYELIVVGAGAAGLIAAARAAELGKRTLLLEKNRKPGVKILISGGTRCNLTHDCDARGIVAAFGSAGPFLNSALARLGPRDVVELFHAEGVPTYVEAGTGKVFPLSDRALDVANALVRRLRRSGAELALGEPVTRIERIEGEERARFRVTTPLRSLTAAKLLVAVGGKSYAGCGTTGDGYRWLAELGHTIRPPRPALVPLTSDAAWVRELSGIAIPDMVLRVAPSDPARPVKRVRGLPPGVLIERRGAVLFTHTGLSGPTPLDVSREVTKAGDPRDVVLLADFFPDVPAEKLAEQLREAAERDGKKFVVGLVPDVLPRRLVEALFVQAEVPIDRRAAEFGKAERARVVEALKRGRIPVSGSRGFDKAEVTAGGVALDEVDSRTMESKLVPGLYLAGEILDLDGFIGGYNFQAAFSTGLLAAESL